MTTAEWFTACMFVAIAIVSGRAFWRTVKPFRGIWNDAGTSGNRAAIADLLWRAAIFAGITTFGLVLTYGAFEPEAGPDDLVFGAVVRAGWAAIALGLLLLPLAWTVRVFAWPRKLVPPALRGESGAPVMSTTQRAERKRRKEAGIAPTDHLVEIFLVTSSIEDYEPYWVANCAADCGWMEFPDSSILGVTPEAQLRELAARHTTNVGKEVIEQLA